MNVQKLETENTPEKDVIGKGCSGELFEDKVEALDEHNKLSENETEKGTYKSCW